MKLIHTKLTTSGNSVAVRLPKALLTMSGLTHDVTLEAKQGKIIISRTVSARQGWDSRIQKLKDADSEPSKEFDAMRVAEADGLESLPWNGPSYADWLKSSGK